MYINYESNQKIRAGMSLQQKVAEIEKFKYFVFYTKKLLKYVCISFDFLLVCCDTNWAGDL